MKIYTKTGDDGTTALVGGSRIEKSCDQLEAYGNIDELNAVLGMALAEICAITLPTERDTKRKELLSLLQNIQNQLFTIGGLLATEPVNWNKFWPSVEVESWTAQLEQRVDEYSAQTPDFKGFVLPSGSKSAAALHVARTVCRRAERAICRFTQDDCYFVVKQYVNRLSDLLFVLARFILTLEDIDEVCWQK